MKLTMSTQDLIAFLSDERVAAVRESIAGAMLALVDSPELQEAIQKRVTAKAEERMTEVLNNAVRKESSWGGKEEIKGWMGEVIKTEFRNHFQHKQSFEHVMRDIITTQFNQLLQHGLADFLRQEARNIITQDLMEHYTKQVKELDVEEAIKVEVKRVMRNMLA